MKSVFNTFMWHFSKYIKKCFWSNSFEKKKQPNRNLTIFLIFLKIYILSIKGVSSSSNISKLSASFSVQSPALDFWSDLNMRVFRSDQSLFFFLCLCSRCFCFSASFLSSLTPADGRPRSACFFWRLLRVGSLMGIESPRCIQQTGLLIQVLVTILLNSIGWNGIQPFWSAVETTFWRTE